jgi:tetratricopeptide (TPR) repeat protein
VGFLKTLFGRGADKDEDKGDELRLDFEYRDAAYYYQQAIDKLGSGDGETAERVRRKLREVRRQALDQLLDEFDELMANDALTLAHEKLELAANFAEDDGGQHEVERRRDRWNELQEIAEEAPEVPESVEGTEGDLLDLALSAMDAADRERASALGEGFRLGFEACQREKWREGLDRFEEVLGEHPDDAMVLELAGIAAEHTQEDERALTYFQRAQSVAPNRAVTVSGLAAIYRRLDRKEDARKLLAEAAAAHPIGDDFVPAWADIHLEHALMLGEAGKHAEAVSILVALLGVRGVDRGFLLYNLAGVLESMGRDHDAMAALEEAIQLSPRQPLYRERLSDFLAQRGQDLEHALRLIEEANQVETTGAAGMLGGGGSRVTISPNRARYLYKLARIYFLKGDDLEADRTATAAQHLARDPEVVRALEELRKDLKEVRQGR